MKYRPVFLIFFLVITWVLQCFLPWWSYVLCFFLLGVVSGKQGKIPFGWIILLGGIGWLFPALLFTFLNQGILAMRIAILFGVNEPFFLILFAGIIGGLLALSGSLLGYALQTIVQKK